MKTGPGASGSRRASKMQQRVQSLLNCNSAYRPKLGDGDSRSNLPDDRARANCASRIASRQYHVPSDNVDVYRFPPILIIALRAGVAVPALLGLGIYDSFGRPPELYEIAFLVFFFGSLTIIVVAQLWVVSHYTLELRIGSLTVNDWRGWRLTSIDEIRKVVIAPLARPRLHGRIQR
jgi:hypothetical protein